MSAPPKPFRLGVLPARHRQPTPAGTLEYVVSGSKAPAIVLLNGAGMTLESWRALYPEIERLGTVFAWNRFGVKDSDSPRLAQSGAVVIASLRELLRYAGLAPPYVLVGHSIGGLYANLFARLHPGEVAGVLFVEATHPDDQEMLQEHKSRLGRVLEKILSLPQRLFRANLYAEIDSVPETAVQIAAAGPFPPVPVAVVTGGAAPPRWLMSAAALQLRQRHQQALAQLSVRGEQVVAAASGHFPQLTEPALVLAALRGLIARALQYES